MKPATDSFDRRTLVVLASLVISMTAVSGLLLLLEPMPLARSGGPILTVLDADPRGAESIFATQPAPDPERWRAIVIHHSGRYRGSARLIAQRHQAQGRAGLGYHFVIGNGDGADDGEIQIGYRWNRQLGGWHGADADSAEWYGRHAVGICLVGDGDRNPPTRAQMEHLVRLVTTLQARLNIPADRVLLRENISPAADPALLFPTAAFRRQLLDVNLRTVDSR